jgi:tetratricopeptide (TPR) repeat protein
LGWSVTSCRIFLAAFAAAICLAHGAVPVIPVPVPAPGKEPSVEQLIENARTSLRLGDLERTRATLERVLTREQTNRQAELALTDVLMRMGRWTDAANQAQVLGRQFPTDTEPVYLLALIAIRRGDPQTARELAGRCVALGDRRPEVYKVMALAEYLLGQDEQFEIHIRAVLKQNSLDAEAQYFLARYLFEIKCYDESLRTFQTVLKIEPEHYKAHYYAGLLYGSNADQDRARQEYLSAIKIIESKEVRYGLPYADMGKQLADAGELDRAIEWLSRGMRNDPACPRVYYEYAHALFQRGTDPGIERWLRQALRLDSGYAEAYYLLARYYKKLGENQMAEQILAKFKDLKDHPVPSPYGLRRQ